MNPETNFLEDDFKELDRLLSLKNISSQDWDNIESLHTYLTRKIERLSYAKTPYKIKPYETSVFNKYKIKKREKKEKQIKPFLKLIALLEPIAIFAFLSFQIWLNFQYTHSIERALMYVGTWLLGFYPAFFAILFNVEFRNEKLNTFFVFTLLFFAPALNLFLSYPITHNIWVSLLHYATWWFGFLFLTMFVFNRIFLYLDNFSTVNGVRLPFLITSLITLSLCFLAYYFRPI